MSHRYQERLDFITSMALDFSRINHNTTYTRLGKEIQRAMASPLAEHVALADIIKKMLWAAQNPNLPIVLRRPDLDTAKLPKSSAARKRLRVKKHQNLRIKALQDGLVPTLKIAAQYNDVAKKVSEQLKCNLNFAAVGMTTLPGKTDIDDSVARWVFSTLADMIDPNVKHTTKAIKKVAIDAFGDALHYLGKLGFAHCAEPHIQVIKDYSVDDRQDPQLRAAACQALKPRGRLVYGANRTDTRMAMSFFRPDGM